MWYVYSLSHFIEYGIDRSTVRCFTVATHNEWPFNECFWILNIQAVVVVFHLICGLQQSSCLFVSPLHPTPHLPSLPVSISVHPVSQIGFSTSEWQTIYCHAILVYPPQYPDFTQVLLPTILWSSSFHSQKDFIEQEETLRVHLVNPLIWKQDSSSSSSQTDAQSFL